jgi:hypothetical protein
MGGLVADSYVPDVLQQMNSRLIGEALTEMVQFQKEFKVFSSQHTLETSFKLLNIAPVGDADRRGFFKFLNLLKKTGASVDGKATKLSGHDQIVATLQSNLEGSKPLSVHFTSHPAEQPKGIVKVTAGDHVFNFSSLVFLTISMPMINADRPKAGARKK